MSISADYHQLMRPSKIIEISTYETSHLLFIKEGIKVATLFTILSLVLELF